MANRKKVTEEFVQEKLAQGYGSGVGSDYKPWENTLSFRSKGNRHRIASIKADRTLHLFSNIERNAFMNAEVKPNFVQYYEQKAMEREVTMAVARSLNIAHPVFPGSDGVPFVMTLDGVGEFLEDKKGVRRIAYDSKHSSAFDQRTLDKLRIHKGYCDYMGIKHIVVTEKTFSKPHVRNLEWIRMGARNPLEVERVPGLFTHLPLLMLSELCQAQEDLSVSAFTKAFECRLSLPPGTGIRLVQILLWNGRVSTELVKRSIHKAHTSELRTVLPLSSVEQADLLSWRKPL